MWTPTSQKKSDSGQCRTFHYNAKTHKNIHVFLKKETMKSITTRGDDVS